MRTFVITYKLSTNDANRYVTITDCLDLQHAVDKALWKIERLHRLITDKACEQVEIVDFHECNVSYNVA